MKYIVDFVYSSPYTHAIARLWKCEEKPSQHGYWGNRDEGYELHGRVRNDLYTFYWGDQRSTLEFDVGEDRYVLTDHTHRWLTLEAA